MVPFAGYLMPVQYSGIRAEHLAVRQQAGIFDVSHMGEFLVSGPGADAFLQTVTINDIHVIAVGQAQYNAICREDGGMLDDLLIYRYSDYYMIVVNAANRQKDLQWLEEHRPPSVRLEDRSNAIALLAVQGPVSRDILADCGFSAIGDLAFYHFMTTTYQDVPVTLARTGYTGELGFEIYIPSAQAAALWDHIMTVGESRGLRPAGLGARDTLRLEMKYCLYGNDIDETTNPIEAELGWITKLDKGDFIGRDAILAAKKSVSRRLVCLKMLERAVPRAGYDVFHDETGVGHVTSGTQSPSLGQGIALAYVDVPHHKIGTKLQISIRGRRFAAVIIKPPFYTSGTALL